MPADPPRRIAAVTIVSQRHSHLTHQLDGIAAAAIRPAEHVIVAMDDPAIRDIAAPYSSTRVVDIDAAGENLPLARARNLGAQSALDAGADLLVFLDVDCVPGREMFHYYDRAAHGRWDERLLYCGPVTYLPPHADLTALVELGSLGDLTEPHSARPDPPMGDVVDGTDMALFWSLSFAVTGRNWRELGGFHTAYQGYGGEDTDFAIAAAEKAFRIAWVGGAHAYHQYHPVSDPPVEHLDDILRNARVFHDRWRWWPMRGWLDAFAEQGLITFDPRADNWIRRNR